jgi:thiol-disulfide isomerase/thioredoxin
MTRNRTLFALCLIGLLLVVGACSDRELDPLSMVGEPVAELRGSDLTGTGVTDLATLAGRPTAVVFWLNTCPHCQDGLTAIEDAWADLAAENNILTVGMTNVDMAGTAGYETPQAFIASTGLTLPTIEYTWEQAQSEWGVTGVPTVFILDDEQMIEDVLVGPEDLVDRIRESLLNVALLCCGTP